MQTGMQFFYVHPNDARWLRQWLRKHLVCVAVMLILILAMRLTRFVPDVAISQGNVAQAASTKTEASTPRVAPPVLSKPAPANVGPISVAPTGWRRTSQGWEHVSSWAPLPRPLGEIIANQVNQEPMWLQSTLAQVRDIPPLVFGLIQIGLIGAICVVSKRSSQATV